MSNSAQMYHVGAHLLAQVGKRSVTKDDGHQENATNGTGTASSLDDFGHVALTDCVRSHHLEINTTLVEMPDV